MTTELEHTHGSDTDCFGTAVMVIPCPVLVNCLKEQREKEEQLNREFDEKLSLLAPTRKGEGGLALLTETLAFIKEHFGYHTGQEKIRDAVLAYLTDDDDFADLWTTPDRWEY